MAEFVFVSPSVKFREIDLTVTSGSVGVTSAGLVGETQKGRAFQPTLVSNRTQFRNWFGGQSKERIGADLKYLLPYYANSYLNESNQLYVTRVLGLSGYDVGKGWGIKISAGLDPDTLTETGSNTGTATFSNGVFSGDTVIAQTGVTRTIQPTYTKVGNTFTGTRIDYVVDNFISQPSGLSGNVSFTATTVEGTSFTEYENMVVALVRTRGRYVNNVLNYAASSMTLTIGNALTNPNATFILNVTGNTNETYECTLDPNSSSFISKVLGTTTKDKNTLVYVEAVYPDLINKLIFEGKIYGVQSELVTLDDCTKVNYKTSYKTPETPWVVSEVRGSEIDRLFKFISISDGDNANREIKISILNINPETKEFDVLIRDFNDNDDNQIVLESFSRCSMNQTDNNFIGRRIGDNGVNFDNLSNYVYLEFENLETLPNDAFPAGFEGYRLRDFSPANTCGEVGLTPKILYKTNYNSDDKLNRTYLGISERAYDTTTKGRGINQNLFNFYGELSEAGSYKTKGFHLDSGATSTYFDGNYEIGEFEVGSGEFRTVLDIQNASQPYFDRRTRKFTVVPYGGFDGWDIYRDERTNKNSNRVGGLFYEQNNDYDAYLTAIRTFENSEEVVINIFATPGINWSDNSALVNEALEMIERERKDSLYIIDAPNLDSPNASTFAEDMADLITTTDLDTSYAATYAPWVQIFDQENSTNLYIPPTGEVLRSIAFTDNSRFPWFAPAGVSRGTINAKKAKYKLTEPQRDVLYSARINPIADFSTVGVDIFGQKTLQVKESALDRINVRRLLLYMRQVISNISITLLFDQNDDIVVNEFLNKVEPFLRNIKNERGLTDFKIEFDSINTPESRDRNELYFNLYLKPVRSLEFIGIGFILTPTGASFENV